MTYGLEKPTLPKGTKFEMKSTVSTTSGGIDKWSATRYESVLNMPATHDFGEFTTKILSPTATSSEER